jgi:hypothetical protein
MNNSLTKKRSLLLLIAFFYNAYVLCVAPAQANSGISSLDSFWYQQSVPLFGSNKKAINDAMQQALKNVFTKVTGKEDICYISSIKSAIKSPTDYIKNHSFAKGYYLNEETQCLLVNFDKTAIQHKLKESGVDTIWDEFSPAVLVVVCLVDKDKQYILQKDDDLAKEITQEASALGVKTIYPIMDMHDFQDINIHDIKAVLTDSLKPTINRYGNPLVLTGFIEKSSYDTYHGRLAFIDAQEKYSLRMPLGESICRVTESISHLLVSNLLPKYSKSLSAEKTVFNIKITNISAEKNIKEIKNYFMSSKILADAYLEEIKNNEVVFRASTDSSIASLKLLFSRDYQFNEMFRFVSEDSSAAIEDNLMNLMYIKNN